MDDGYEGARRLIDLVLLDEFWSCLESATLTAAGLLRLRARLDPAAGEFAPTPAVARLRIATDDALAEALGCDPADVPGSLLAVPDFPPSDG